MSISTLDTYKPRVRKAAEETKSTPLIEGNSRPDGRTLDQLRPIFMKTGVVSQAAGSAYIESQQTKVICAIYGPRQPRNGQFREEGSVWCDFKFAPFAQSARRKRGQDPDEREYAELISTALEVCVLLHKFPKNVLEVYILILQDDGGALAASLTCASLALADAGIEVYDMMAACSAAMVDSSILLDPTLAEESARKAQSMQNSGSNEGRGSRMDGSVLVAYMPSLGQVAHLTQTGCVHKPLLLETINLCIDGCCKIYASMQQHLAQSMSKKMAKKQPAE
eukprot:TRINITY_DN10157_c0_g1_i1.p1 TRINITY_DN10157_c0_g1~~TRINITY_DN10157_c0_g1_i1.p1  ORF type:complete len:280 (+),score=25.37 TRINITY_DN10157_c0_g1_i1:82-921(+)